MSRKNSPDVNLGLLALSLAARTPLTSAAAPLAAGDTWDSGWLDTQNFVRLLGMIKGDKAHTFQIIQSVYGAIEDMPGAEIVAGAGDADAIDAVLALPYFKVKVTNTDAGDDMALQVALYGRGI